MKLFLVAFLMFTIPPREDVSSSGEKMEWKDLSTVSVQLKADSKPVLIDLFTSWCYWCKVMDKKTYSDKNVIHYLKENFYSVKLNAETKETINWNGKEFKYNLNYKCNDFALYATQGQLSFPTTVIIPEVGSDPIAIAGFMEPQEMEAVLKYFGSGAYKKENFQTYQSKFSSTW
jgi:thioredoxin-related protein